MSTTRSALPNRVSSVCFGVPNRECIGVPNCESSVCIGVPTREMSLCAGITWNVTQPWSGDTDHCDSWFTRGTLNQDANNMTKLQTNMTLENFDEWGQKWVLSVPPDSGGYLTISNPGNSQASVYVDHMKLCPEKDQYPLTKASLGNSSVELNPRFEIDLPFPAHITTTAYVGTIDAGATMNISFTPLESGMANAFRVTGFIVTPTDEQLFEKDLQRRNSSAFGGKCHKSRQPVWLLLLL